MHFLRLRPRLVLLSLLAALGLAAQATPAFAALDVGVAPPVAIDDAATVKTLTTIHIRVLDNDTDADGDFLEITSPTVETDTAHGTVICDFDLCSYTSDAEYLGPDGFDYTVSDGNGGTDVGHVSITVGTNTPPVAADDEAEVRAGAPRTIPVLANDLDPDGDPLEVTTPAPTAAHGTVACEETGECLYTPAPGYLGEDGFDYAISDGNGGIDTAHVSILVAENTPPEAINDDATRSDSTVIDVLANDSDPNGDEIELVSVTPPAFGTATINPDEETITYSQTSNFAADDSFMYTISDGLAQSTATVTLEACPQLSSAMGAGSLVVSERWVACSAPHANGAVGPTTSVFPPAEGTSALLTSGDIANAPGPNDDTGATTGNGTDLRGARDVSILRLDLNVPMGANCLSFDLAFQSEEFPEYVNQGFNDGFLAELDASDWSVDGEAITAPNNFAFDSAGGIVSVNSAFFSPDRVITETGSQYDGSTPLLNVRRPITPGAHVLYLSIFDAGDAALDSGAFVDRLQAGAAGPGGCSAGANEPPDAVADAVEVQEDASTHLDVLLNDTDPDGHPLAITSASPSAAHGTVACTAGACVYTPDANYNGPDSFTYAISDGHGGTDTATVSITVLPQNDAPVALDDSLTTAQGTPGSLNVLANDTDVDGPSLSVSGAEHGAHGSVGCTAAGICTYTPTPGYSGPDSFTYFISDGAGGIDQATVSVTVTPAANQPPVADDETLTTAEDTAGQVNVLVGDTDPDPGDTLTVTSLTPSASHGSVSCTAAGVCTYTPNANYHGPDSFVYTVSDGKGGQDTGQVSITVTPVNDPPDAIDDSVTTAEDTEKVVRVLDNDVDADGVGMILQSWTQPAHGTVTCGASCVYTPAANYNGPDSFTYTISGFLHPGTDTATVSVTVTPVNDTPTTVDDELTTPEDTAKSLNVLANDFDVDGDSLALVEVFQPVNGAVSCTSAGVCTYTPEPNFHGANSFTYRVSDGNGGFKLGSVSVTVTPVNDDPNAVNDSLTTAEDTPGSLNMLANDGDLDGDSITVTTAAPTAAHGTVSCTAAGECTYTPEANYNGPDLFVYGISDGNGGSDTATVSITVTPINDAPNAVNDSLITTAGTAKNVNVLANDSDVDGDSLAATAHTTASNGTVNCTAAGVCTYTPNPGYVGADSFTYTISDGHGGTDTASVNVTVEAAPPNQPPNAVDDSLTTAQDTVADLNVLANDTDDGAFQLVSNTQPAHGSVICTVAGDCTYTPAAGYHGPDSFTYTIGDGQAEDTATVSITVTPVNTAPSCADVKPSKTKLWPPRHQFVLIALSGATDADGDPLAWSITKVTQDEKTKGAISKNDKGPDAQRVGGKPHQVKLKAERVASGNGRVYRIFFTVSDGQGGTCSGKVKVGVPKTKNGNAFDNLNRSFNSFG